MIVVAVGTFVGVLSMRRWENSDKSAPASPEGTSNSGYTARPKGTITFSKDIAPILYERCVSCHRPGGSGPFNLLTYADARKHASDIVRVTSSRYMPPWLPAPGFGSFVGERTLSRGELGLLRQWKNEGAVEGRPSDLPPLPVWVEGWRLGVPDLVVPLPAPYTLAATGRDVYRNFVVPIPTTARRFVRAAEFRPGNPKVVHHAFIDIDETRRSQRLAQRQTPAGFDGMDLPPTAHMPEGQQLGWQPGKTPHFTPDGLSWALNPGTDLVLQLHMHPSGKEEQVQPLVGFYFTDTPPTNTPFRINLSRYDIDIPAGASNHVVTQDYVLPVDVQVLGVLPHAHYLAREMLGFAILPNGAREWIIKINDWDFNWQGDYQLARPLPLPKGSRLVMRFTYDNSANNARNPNQPPKRVRFGLQTTDEMGSLNVQVLPANESDRRVLSEDFHRYIVQVNLDADLARLRLNPDDAEAHIKLAAALEEQGRLKEAIDHFEAAERLNPGDDRVHYDLGRLRLLAGDLTEAQREFEEAVRINPADNEACGSLGVVCLKLRQPADARRWLTAALRLDPDDGAARRYLEMLERAGY